MVKVITIDAGHGGNDSGAILGKRYEKNDTLKMALKIKDLVEQQGIKVVLTRSGDTNPTLSQRCDIANNANSDYLLSIHRNAHNNTAKGVEIWVYSKANTSTYNQAKGILDNIVKIPGTVNGGVKKGYTADATLDYAINRESTMPSGLLELLFISNPNENKLFDSNFDKYAEAIAKGLCSAVGVTYKSPTSTSPDKLYRVQVGAFSSKSNADKMAEELQNKGYSTIIKVE